MEKLTLGCFPRPRCPLVATDSKTLGHTAKVVWGSMLHKQGFLLCKQLWFTLQLGGFQVQLCSHRGPG